MGRCFTLDSVAVWIWESARVLGPRSCFSQGDLIQDRFRRFSGTIVFLFFTQNRRNPVENKFIPIQKMEFRSFFDR
jgi:hypothetical protein